MPQLQIGEHTVEVGEEFLALPPEHQQATVDEIASAISNNVDQDIAKSVLTGAKDLATGTVGFPGTVEGFLGQGVDAFAQAQGSDYRYPRMLPNISEVNAAVDPYLPEALTHESQTPQGEVASWVPAIAGAIMGRPSASFVKKLTHGAGTLTQASAIPAAMYANNYGVLASGATFAGMNWFGKLLKKLGGAEAKAVAKRPGTTRQDITESLARGSKFKMTREPQPLTPEQYMRKYGEESNSFRNAQELKRRLEIDELARRRDTINLTDGPPPPPPWAR
jgi:hypothetical protein